MGTCREATIVRAIMERSRSVPGMLLRKRHGSVWSVAGDPDLYGSWNGQHVEIEVKRPGEEPTPLQKKRLADWNESGAMVAVCCSVRDFNELLMVKRQIAPAAWVSCPCCDEFQCTLHRMHVFDCPCPPIDQWSIDPYVTGGLPWPK
jgi:hypothetical protein